MPYLASSLSPKRVALIGGYILLLGLASRGCDSDLPTCKVAFNANGTWDAIGWNPSTDGYNNCDLPLKYGDLPVIVSPNGNWRIK
jgi:hypothetical protein